MYHVSLAFQCIYGCRDEGGENGDGEDKKRYLKVNASKDKVVVLN